MLKNAKEPNNLKNYLSEGANKMDSTKLAVILAAVMSCGIMADAQINLSSSAINFRDANSAVNTTVHYGDFQASGGNSGSSWGWLWGNAVNCYGWGSFTGNLSVYGNSYVYGTKSFVQPHPTDTTKVIAYVAVEAGEALTLARGTATTMNGQAVVNLPDHFSLVTSATGPLIVLLTPENEPVQLFVRQKSKDQITVAMKSSDFSEFRDVPFDYQVTGVRDGFEGLQAVRAVDSIDNDGTSVSPRKMAIIARNQKIVAKYLLARQNARIGK
jgi:hypothetical protein